MIYKVDHLPQKEMLIPLAAMSDAWDFILDQGERAILFSDETEAKVQFARTLHALSEDFMLELQRIYGTQKKVSLETFLKKWYSTTDQHMVSMEFLYVLTK